MKNGNFRHLAVLSALVAFLGFGAVQVGGLWSNDMNTAMTSSLASISPAAGDEKAAKKDTSAKKTASASKIGAEFSLIDHNGNAVTNADFTGKYMLVFFGFTNCPDVCPAGLSKIASAVKSLGPQGEQIQPVFITIDPERDGPQEMKEYVGMFLPNMVGLTGSKEDLQKTQNGYKVYSEKVDSDDMGGYMMNHSAYIYLMGRDGEFVTVFSSDDTPAEIAWEIKRILSEENEG